MVRKLLAFLKVILVIICIYLIQIYVIDSRTLFGIKPNLVLVSVITISLWYGLYIGSFYSLIIGFLTDLIFLNSNGIFTISYTITGTLIGFFNYNYRRENRVALLYVTAFGILLFEFVEYTCYIFIASDFVNIFYFIKQVIISSLLNICMAYILYGILYKITKNISEGLSDEETLQELR
ncbi:MAG: rod shape-determining protein MreD [Clostridia bacterium]|nr:rod shape-determining protein MreD [Clostridia bacterium]